MTSLSRMRTTLTLDDDVAALATEYAKRRLIELGKAVSELVRRGARRKLATRVVNGLTVVDLPPDSPPVTTEWVKRLEAEDW